MQAPNFFGMKIPDDVGIEEQECIPVGCVQSVAVVVSWEGGGGCLPGGCLIDSPFSPVNRMTDRCKNITLPQLRCGR